MLAHLGGGQVVRLGVVVLLLLELRDLQLQLGDLLGKFRLQALTENLCEQSEIAVPAPLVVERHMTTFITRLAVPPAQQPETGLRVLARGEPAQVDGVRDGRGRDGVVVVERGDQHPLFEPAVIWLIEQITERHNYRGVRLFDLDDVAAAVAELDDEVGRRRESLVLLGGGLAGIRRQRAEQAAQKAAVKLLMPLALFLFPTLFIIILGPAILNISDMLTGSGSGVSGNIQFNK